MVHIVQLAIQKIANWIRTPERAIPSVIPSALSFPYQNGHYTGCRVCTLRSSGGSGIGHDWKQLQVGSSNEQFGSRHFVKRSRHLGPFWATVPLGSPNGTIVIFKYSNFFLIQTHVITPSQKFRSSWTASSWLQELVNLDAHNFTPNEIGQTKVASVTNVINCRASPDDLPNSIHRIHWHDRSCDRRNSLLTSSPMTYYDWLGIHFNRLTSFRPWLRPAPAG